MMEGGRSGSSGRKRRGSSNSSSGGGRRVWCRGATMNARVLLLLLRLLGLREGAEVGEDVVGAFLQ